MIQPQEKEDSDHYSVYTALDSVRLYLDTVNAFLFFKLLYMVQL